jgi:hypothetical protein
MSHLLNEDAVTAKLAVHCENHMKHSNTNCEQNASFIMVKQVVRIVTTGLKKD